MLFKYDNIWKIDTVKNNSTIHPAVFPEQLAGDNILSWSNKNDIIFDPMVGSGTTCKMAKLLGRNFIGFDIAKEYIDITRNRLKKKSPESAFRAFYLQQ